MNKDNRAELGRLIREELEVSRRGPSAVVQGWTESATRSFYGWKDGDTVPLRRSRAMLEDALGWRRGVVSDILDAPITRTFTLSEVREWTTTEPGAVRSRDLSDDELLAELTRRFGNYRMRLDELQGEDVAALREREQHHYGLAASDEHVPGEDDRD